MNNIESKSIASQIKNLKFDNVRELTLNTLDFNGEKIFFDPIELLNFPNLESLIFINIEIDYKIAEIINSLKKIHKLEFYNCSFECLINQIKCNSLLICNSKLNKSDNLVHAKLQSFHLINQEIDDLSFLYKSDELKKLGLISCKIARNEFPDNLFSLESFEFSFSDISALRKLSNSKNLRKICATKNDFIKNKKELSLLLLKNKNIKFYDEFNNGFVFLEGEMQ